MADDALTSAGYMITCRALAPLIMHADELGWKQQALLKGVGLDEAHIRKASNPLTWDSFVRYVSNFQDELGGPDEFNVLRERMLPSYEGRGALLGLVTSPRSLFEALNRWGGPGNFPLIDHKTLHLGENKLQVQLKIPDDAADCPAFFRVSKLMFEMAPLFIGHRPALVSLEIAPRVGTFVIDMPPSFTLWARIRRAFRSIFFGDRMMEELGENQDRLLEKHAELQKTHKTLLKSEENFRDLIEQMPDGVLVLNGEETVYANPAMHEFLGVEAGGLNDGRISKFVSGGPLVATVLGLLADDDEVQSEVEFRRADESTVVGNIVPMEATWNGEPALVLVVQDITERNRLMDRALQLDRVIAVGTMAAGVAHEINNPMAFIHSNLEYARETLNELHAQTDETDPLRKRLVNVIESMDEALEGSTRVRDIVWDLKSFSRAPEETRVPVDLVEAVRSAINMSWHEVRNHAKVRTEYAEVPPVLANSGRLSQVVLNLVVNAAQAMPDRDRDLNVVTIRTLEDPDRGVIEVEDNGVGIAPEHLRRIFDPFFTTKAVGEGTGLGLWICQDIITRLGGHLSVESAVNRGTIFRIELPYSAEIDAEAPSGVDIQTVPPPVEPEPEPTQLHTSPARDTGRHRVLMIDDEPKILKMVERIMSNCDVVTFDDPHVAMQYLHRDERFDVVLCDATMPGMNGRDVFRRLQAEYPELAERFVLVTGGLTTNWERTEFPLIVTKPFNIEELRSIVQLIAADPTMGETPSIH